MKAISTLLLFLFFASSQSSLAQTCTGFGVLKPDATDVFTSATWGQTNGSFTFNSAGNNYTATSSVPDALLTITSPSFTINTALPIRVGAQITSTENNGSNKLQYVRIEVWENGSVINCYQEPWHNTSTQIGASFLGLIGKTVQFRFVMKRESNNAERTLMFDNFGLLAPTVPPPGTCLGIPAAKPATLDPFNTATWGTTNGSFTYNSTNQYYEAISQTPEESLTITSTQTYNITSTLPITVGASISSDNANSTKIASVKIEVLENGVVIDCFQQGWVDGMTSIGARFLGLSGKTVSFRFIIKREDSQAKRTTIFDDFSLDIPSEIGLPVTFIDITARKNGNAVNVTWTVADEIDVKGYEVETSTNGSNFHNIGFVPAAKLSSYTFSHPSPQNGINYYRVKNVDYDGKSKYSTIARINLSTMLSLKAFPLPAADAVTIEHGIGARGTLQLNTADGRALKAVNVAEGTSQTTLDISALQRGLYLVRFIKENGSTETLKIIKQ